MPERSSRASSISAVVSVVAGLTVLAYFAGFTAGSVFHRGSRWRRVVNTSYDLVHDKYVDQEKAKHEDLTVNALRGIYSGLDDYSRFFSPEEYKDFKQDMERKYGGVGLIISTEERGIKVITPIVGGPAFEAGILPGDIVVEIDGRAASGATVDDARDRMRGEPDTEVELKILRPATDETFEVTLTRRIVHVPSVLSARLLRLDGPRKVGYVALADFQDDAVEILSEAVDELVKAGMQALVLDLRGNGGGAYDSALKVADLFLDSGVIVQVRYREGDGVVEKASERSLGEFPLVVLVNGGSASASEIVAAALVENDRAVLVGEPTYGKGSVQQVFDISLPDGRAAAAKLTVAFFYSPSGNPISRFKNGTDRGITPDHIVEMGDKGQERYGRALRNEWILANTGKAEGPFLEEVDPQLRKALEVLGVLPGGEPMEAPAGEQAE